MILFFYRRFEVLFNVKGCIRERARRREVHEYESTAAPDDATLAQASQPIQTSRLSKPLTSAYHYETFELVWKFKVLAKIPLECYDF